MALGVKIKYEDDIKTIDGTTALEESIGGLVIFDKDGIVARFDDKVERLWKESKPSHRSLANYEGTISY